MGLDERNPRRGKAILWGAAVLIVAGLLCMFLAPTCRFFHGDRPPPNPRLSPNGWGQLNTPADPGAPPRDAIPGIDYCAYAANSSIPGLVFFLWGDFVGGAGGTNTVDRNGLRFHGHLYNASAQRQVEYKGDAKDGKTGRVAIEGKEYNLADGTLFLVSARRGYAVKQITRNMESFDSVEDLFQELRRDPEIAEFFGGAAAPK